MSAAETIPEKPQFWSHPKTSEQAFRCLQDLDWGSARVADVGAGCGHFSYILGEHVRGLGLDPRERVFPCDLIPASFEYEKLDCQPIAEDGSLPFADHSLDAVISIEVVEHVENQFAFMRELCRVVKPGGLVIVTTPNTHNANSRVRNLVWGFPLLYDPLPLQTHDPRLLDGHIHPISPYFLAYNAIRCGLRDLQFFGDRTKSSAVLWAILIKPLMWWGSAFHHGRLKRKHGEVARENAKLIQALNSWTTLTSRTTIIAGRTAG